MKNSQKQKKSYVIAVLLFLGGLLAWMLSRIGKNTSANQMKREVLKDSNQTQKDIAKLQIKKALQLTKYEKYTSWITAIAQFETANFSSRIFNENRNAFGMTVPRIRPFLGTSSNIYHEGLPMAKYSSTYRSAQDFVEYLKYFNYPTNIKSIDSFVKMMKDKGYFSDSYTNYLKGVKSYLNPSSDLVFRPNVNITMPVLTGTPILSSGAIANMNQAYDLPSQNLQLKKKEA